MRTTLDILLVLLALTNLAALGASRVAACVRIVAIQGAALGLVPLLAHADKLQHFDMMAARLVGLAGASISLKGVVFPLLLTRALREVSTPREDHPFVGYTASILAGAASLGLSFWLASRLPLPEELSKTATSPLVVPVALSMTFSGLFMITARKLALYQVLGYLILENGVYAFGVALALEAPVVVELGVLLDVFVAVFVMGIAIFHISRQFDHIDTERMSSLRD
jgi:hydrogenase-4 component E